MASKRTRDVLWLGTCSVDVDRGVVWRGGESASLTTRERELLAYLVAHPRRTISFEELHREVWGFAPTVISRAAYYAARRLRLKLEEDPAQPRHFITVHGEGLRFEPSVNPTPTAADAPVRGREATLKRLREALFRHGRVCLVGAGGVGKSHTAARLVREATRPAWTCRLVTARTADDVLRLICEAVELPGQPNEGRDALLPRLGRVLATRGESLLVLDGFEHLIDVGWSVVEAISAMAPAVQILITSRHGVPDVPQVRLGPLGMREAVELFVRRARTASAGFELTESPILTELVGRLDRLPLAIELAAARASLLTPAQILERLDARFRVLRQQAGSGMTRSMEATLDWSWNLLLPREREALSRLAVFRAPFDLEAVEAVLTPNCWQDALWGPDALQSLYDKSMLFRIPGDGPPRFALFEGVRAYLAQRAPVPQETRGCHAAWCVSRFHLDETLRDVQDAGPYIDDLADATDWFAAAEEIELAVAAWLPAAAHAVRRGPSEAALARTDALLAHAPPVPERIRLLRVRASLLPAHRGAEAILASQEAVELAEARGDLLVLGLALTEHGERLILAGELAHAEQVCTRALRVLEELGDEREQAAARSHLGGVALLRGDTVGAERSFRAALRIQRTYGDEVESVRSLAQLGSLACMRRAYDEAVELGGEALRLTRTLGISNREADAAWRLGLIHEARGATADARRCLEAAISAARRVGDLRYEALSEGGLCELALTAGDALAAASHGRAACRAARLVGDRNVEGWYLASLAEAEMLGGDPEEATRALDRAEALLTEIGSVRNLAFVLGARGRIALKAGDRDAAREALARVDALIAEMALGADSDLASAARSLREALASP